MHNVVFHLVSAYFFLSHNIQTQNRKFGTMDNIMKKKRMGKQVQNT